MTADTVIRGGLVVDGTGAPARRADVAVDAGRITDIGDRLDGRQVIDADGAWLTPGFVDPHTHLDAQLFWDPSGLPSLAHGVTTAFIGACGFGIAPCGPGAERYLLRCLEAVEEIPFADMRAGVPFGWRTYAQYLDALDALPLGINVATFVPHSPLRHTVVGDDAADRAATGDEVERLADALSAALDAGAFGFATSRGPNHVDGDGRPVPSRAADDTELRALVARCAGRVWQINVEAKGDPTGEATAAEVARYAEWSREFDTTLTWTPLLVPAGTDGSATLGLADQAEALTAGGARVYPQVCPMPLVTDVSLTEASLLRSIPVWDEFSTTVAASSDRRAVLDDDAWRARLREVPEDHSSLLGPVYARWTIASSPTHSDLAGRDLAAVALERGGHPVDVLLDVMRDDDLATVVQVAVINLEPDTVRTLVNHPGTVVGLGDAGAHVRSITNYAYPTTLLHEQVVEDAHLSVERAVHLITQRPATIFGLADRGVLEPGSVADICVIDPSQLDPGAPHLVDDLPAGGGRLMQIPTGMRSVLVAGQVAIESDQPTHDPCGELLRRR